MASGIRVNPKRIRHGKVESVPPRAPEDKALTMAREIYNRTWDYVEAHQVTLDETPRVSAAFGALILEIHRVIAERDDARTQLAAFRAFVRAWEQSLDDGYYSIWGEYPRLTEARAAITPEMMGLQESAS